jgi:hypothetical protein
MSDVDSEVRELSGMLVGPSGSVSDASVDDADVDGTMSTLVGRLSPGTDGSSCVTLVEIASDEEVAAGTDGSSSVMLADVASDDGAGATGSSTTSELVLEEGAGAEYSGVIEVLVVKSRGNMEEVVLELVACGLGEVVHGKVTVAGGPAGTVGSAGIGGSAG